MTVRQTAFPPIYRAFAAMGLIVFVAAQTLCFFHCKFGDQRDGPVSLSCHGVASAQSCHDTSESASQCLPSSSSSCPTLKNIVSVTGNLAAVVPDLPMVYLAAAFSFASQSITSGKDAELFRPTRDSEWIFTPEVSLGPAFRSLAPPFLA